jgi:hypothetical protein
MVEPGSAIGVQVA